MKCTVPGCLEVVHSAVRLQKHFMYRHFISTVAVVQEEKEPLLRCDSCGMHMPVGWFISHRRTALCDRNTQMIWRRRDVAIAARCLEETFSLT